MQVFTDNVSATAYINFQGGPSWDLTELVTTIWTLAWENNIVLSAKHLAGRLNVQADYLSRMSTPYDWKLHPRLFQYLNKVWGPHSIDRLSSMTSTHLPVYNSWFWDPATSAVDALAQHNWQRENNFVNPPFRLISQVLDVIEEQQATATLIAPR